VDRDAQQLDELERRLGREVSYEEFRSTAASLVSRVRAAAMLCCAAA
jgi:hypothetical protein